MIIKDIKLGGSILCHPDVIPLVRIVVTFDLSDQDQYAFLHATNLLATHKDFPKLRKRVLNAIFTVQKEIVFQFEDNDAGNQGNFAFFNFSIIYGRNFNHAQKVIVFLEEFAHHFWDVSDEIKIKRIVCEIAPKLVSYDYVKGEYVLL